MRKNRPEAFLFIDGRHVRQALDHLVVANVHQKAQVSCLFVLEIARMTCRA